MSVSSEKTSNRRYSRKVVTEAELRQMIPFARSTTYYYAQKGYIPGVIRVGRRVYFDLQKIEAWIEAGGNVKEVGQ